MNSLTGSLYLDIRTFTTKDTPMEQHYRQHVIVYDTSYNHKPEGWKGTARVRFSEGVQVRIMSVQEPVAYFRTKEEAEEDIIAVARKWIDRRVETASGPFSAKKKTRPTEAQQVQPGTRNKPV